MERQVAELKTLALVAAPGAAQENVGEAQS